MPLAGGTTLLLEWNRGRQLPAAVLDLSRVDELRRVDARGESLRLGARLTYAELMQLETRLPALAQAAGVVGSPQLRNLGTLGGCVAVPEAAGDVLPALLVEDASVELASVHGERVVALADYLAGDRMRGDELLTAVLARSGSAAEAFLKVGPRNAATASIVAVAVSVGDETAAAACRVPGSPACVVRGPSAQAAALADRLVDVAVFSSDSKASAAYRRRAARVLALRGFERCAA